MSTLIMSATNPLASSPTLNLGTQPNPTAQMVQNLAQSLAQNIAQNFSQNLVLPNGNANLSSGNVSCAPVSSTVTSSSNLTTTETIEDQAATENMIQLSSAEERERKIFMAEVNKFMAEIGKPLSKIPIMGYKELDLYQLYKEVIGHGGFIEVVKNVGTWSKIWKRLGNFDPSITDSSFRLKKNYERYLLEYEYKCHPDHRV